MTAAPSFPSLLTLCFQGREGLPWLANCARPWSPQLDAVRLPCLCQMPVAAAKLRNQSQKHEHLFSIAMELGVSLEGYSGALAGLALSSLPRDWGSLLDQKALTGSNRPDSSLWTGRVGTGGVLPGTHTGPGEGTRRTEQDAAGHSE